MGYMREAELAKELRVSQRTLREWRAMRLVPFFKINRLVVYDPERVRKALERFERKEVSRAIAGYSIPEKD
jgi:hypothetical protein